VSKDILRRLFTVAAAATFLLLYIVASPVAAAEPERQIGGRHCTVRIERISPDGSETRIASRSCFATYAESFRYATRGRVSVPNDLRPEQVTDSMVDAGIESVVVLGTDWDRKYYSTLGWSVNWEASSTCTASLSWTVSYVGSQYNDAIESAKSYGGCHKFHHWEHSNFGGAVLICQPNCSTMGVMANQTSSLSWDY
jgi:hypothetical protein